MISEGERKSLGWVRLSRQGGRALRLGRNKRREKERKKERERERERERDRERERVDR